MWVRIRTNGYFKYGTELTVFLKKRGFFLVAEIIFAYQEVLIFKESAGGGGASTLSRGTLSVPGNKSCS
jgi:hypothetical protein